MKIKFDKILGKIRERATWKTVSLDVTNFDNNLSIADDTVQKAFDTLNNLSVITRINFSFNHILDTVTIPIHQQMWVWEEIDIEWTLILEWDLILNI